MGTRELDSGQTFSKPRNCSQSRGGLKTRGLVRFKNLQANIVGKVKVGFAWALEGGSLGRLRWVAVLLVAFLTVCGSRACCVVWGVPRRGRFARRTFFSKSVPLLRLCVRP